MEILGKKKIKESLKGALFKPAKNLAANYRLYNAFLSAGLVWSLFISDQIWVKFSKLCNCCKDLWPNYGFEKKYFLFSHHPRFWLWWVLF